MDDTVYYAEVDVDNPSLYFFNPNDVQGEANAINLGDNSQGFGTGQRVVYNTDGGTAIGGLTSGSPFFVNVFPVGDPAVYWVRFFGTEEDARNDTNPIAFDFGPATGGHHFIQHLVRVQLYDSAAGAILANAAKHRPT